MNATFFPKGVLSSLKQLEVSIQYHDEDDDLSTSAEDLATELRLWEREWKAGRARLVPQVEAKANGEGGI